MARFAQLTDFHLRPPGVLTQGTIDTDGFTSAAVDAVLARHPGIDAVIVTGDLADLGEAGAYARAAALLSRFAVPVIVVPGNHDSTARLRAAFAAFPGVAEPPVAGKVCHAHAVNGVTVVALDTSVDGLASFRNEGELGAEQLAWLDDTLAGASGPVLIAMHHPPFRVDIGFMDAIGLVDRDDFAAVLARHANVRRIACGHIHRTTVGAVAGVPAMAIPGVAHQVVMALNETEPAAIVMEPPAYGIHIVDEAGGSSHVGYVGSFGEPVGFTSEEPIP